MPLCKKCWREKSECICHLPDFLKQYRKTDLKETEWFCPRCKAQLYVNLRVGEFVCKNCESTWLINIISE